MDLPSDSETIYSDSEISSVESIHDSDLDFIDDSDLTSSDESDCSDDSSDEDFQDNKCTIFKSIVIFR